MREASLALESLRATLPILRIGKVEKRASARSADAGSSWGNFVPPHPPARYACVLHDPSASVALAQQKSHAHTMNSPLPLDTLVLCILDGWGIGQGDMETTGDAIRLASKLGKTPNWDRLCKESLISQLETSGESVGLPEGQMGNSEVGHTHIGAGRIVKQSLTRINEAIESGEFSHNEGLEAFVSAFKAKEKQGVVHVAGIVSSGGVHGSKRACLGNAKIFSWRGLRVKLHAFLDGRDTPPHAAIEELPRFLDACEEAVGRKFLGERYRSLLRDG